MKRRARVARAVIGAFAGALALSAARAFAAAPPADFQIPVEYSQAAATA